MWTLRAVRPMAVKPEAILAGLRQASSQARLSGVWLPTGGIAATENETGHGLLQRAGFLRQSHAGIFHLLPFGKRVQSKLERLIDKHMRSVGASEVSLSSLSSEELWARTGRLQGYGQELFRLEDRKKTPYILTPTHEEEVTTLVARAVTSYKQLPLRLYQIGRKYRDELRPRHGLLRSREFLMKDLYTFDATADDALKTYDDVSVAYRCFFDELGLPYVVAAASSGDIGGETSHEYHLIVPSGEDNVLICDSCDYVANEEVAISRASGDGTDVALDSVLIWRGVTKDRKTLISVVFPNSGGLSLADVNKHMVKSIVPDLDLSIEDATPLWSPDRNKELLAESKSKTTMINIFDHRISHQATALPMSRLLPPNSNLDISSLDVKTVSHSSSGEVLNMLRIREGDACAQCEEGKLEMRKAVELGHTFHLGSRYSEPLDARATLRSGASAPLQMGCHGIGVSRIMGAVADYMADDKGLNWPRSIAPFEVVIIPGRDVDDLGVNEVYNCFSEAAQVLADETRGRTTDSALDAVIDDRDKTFSYKMVDAELVGYPVIVLIGRGWARDRACEVQCKRLGIKEEVPFDKLAVFVHELFDKMEQR